MVLSKIRDILRNEIANFPIYRNYPKHPNFSRTLYGSRAAALDGYRKLENYLERSSDKKEQYHAFMKEYLDMGHM